MLGPVALPGRAGTYELEFHAGRIAALHAREASSARLALPAFVDLHVHADRAYARGPRPARSLADAIALVAELKRTSTQDQVRERALRLFARARSHGTLRLRTHVDVDELVEARALHGVLAAREAIAETMDVEIVAFATAHADPSTADGARRLASAVEQGADLVGSAPAFHERPGRSVAGTLDIARSLGLGVDFHLDETVDPTALLLETTAEATIARGLEGRVAVSHCSALASVDRAVAKRTIEKVAAAGLTVIALPALNLFLGDRGAGTPRLRGVTLVRELVDAGVAVRFGSDNVGDVFYPYGDADPLEAAWLAALTAHVDDASTLLAGICGGRNRVGVGDRADLILVEAQSLEDALARRPGGRTIVRAGEREDCVQIPG